MSAHKSIICFKIAFFFMFFLFIFSNSVFAECVVEVDPDTCPISDLCLSDQAWCSGTDDVTGDFCRACIDPTIDDDTSLTCSDHPNYPGDDSCPWEDYSENAASGLKCVIVARCTGILPDQCRYCVTPTCNENGIEDNEESGKDCGGGGCPACPAPPPPPGSPPAPPPPPPPPPPPGSSSGTISASPNPCTITSGSTCSSTISWSTPAGTNVNVRPRISSAGNCTGNLFSSTSPSGSLSAPFIDTTGHNFDLCTNTGTFIATVFVQGQTSGSPPPPTPPLTPPPPGAPNVYGWFGDCPSTVEAGQPASYSFKGGASSSSPPSVLYTQVFRTQNLQPSSVISNGDFENQLASWNCGGAVSGSCIADPISPLAGSYSGKVINTGGGSWGWQLAQGGISATPGEQFNLSGWIKKQIATDNVRILIQAEGGFGEQLAPLTSQTTNWQYISGTVTIPTNGTWWSPTNTLAILLREYDIGSVWFDDVAITKMEPWVSMFSNLCTNPTSPYYCPISSSPNDNPANGTWIPTVNDVGIWYIGIGGVAENANGTDRCEAAPGIYTSGNYHICRPGNQIDLCATEVTFPPPGNFIVDPFTVNSSSCSDINSPYIDVSWSSSSSATDYTIYRDNNAIAQNLPASTTAYRDGAVTNGTAYTYQIQACNSKGCVLSNPSSTTAASCPKPNITVILPGGSNPTDGPIIISPGNSVTVIWEAPTDSSCTASSPPSNPSSTSWSGGKAPSGSESIGPLSSLGTYQFTLTCTDTGLGSITDNVFVEVSNKYRIETQGDVHTNTNINTSGP